MARIPIKSGNKVVYWTPRRARPWRLWLLVVALPFVAAALVEILR